MFKPIKRFLLPGIIGLVVVFVVYNLSFKIALSAIGQGIIWSIMALGVYITFRLLDFADLSVDGSFATGGMITAILLTHGHNPFFSLLAAMFGGAIAGFLTAFMNTKMKIPPLLSGILTQMGLYSINLRITGNAPNVALISIKTIFTSLEAYFADKTIILIILGVIFSTCVMLFMYWFFGTEIGMMIRATGKNQKMVRAMGLSTDVTIMIGLILSNALVALSGALVAQQQGFANVQMGAGVIVKGLAAIIIGEVLLPVKSFYLRLTSVVIGSILFRLIISFVIKQGLTPSDLNLISAILVALILFIPKGIEQMRQKRLQREQKNV